MSEIPIGTVVSADGRLRAGLVVLEPGALETLPPPGLNGRTLAERGHQSLILDLSRLGEADSSTLGWFVRIGDELESAGGSLVLLGLQERTRVVIGMLGLNAFFHVANDLEEAFTQIAIPRPRRLPPPERRAPVYGAPPPRRPQA